MNRRTFLAASAASAVVASWPRLIRRAFADASVDGMRGRAGQLASGWERATKNGKPLLTIVVPAEDGPKWARGTWFGEWLNTGSDEQMAPLALAEVACATMREIAQLAPSVGSGEPLMVLLDEGAPPRRLEATLPTGDEDAAIDGRVAALSSLARDALFLDEKMVARRADRARRFLGEGEASGLQFMLAQGGDPRPELADRGAAIVALASLRAERPRALKLRQSLAAAAKERLRVRPPTGGHWARSSMCGPTVVEDLPDPSDNAIYGCGMGHLPSRSRRFLYFWSKSPSARDAERYAKPKDG